MKKEIVGFMGCYSHDVILMAAKTAVSLGRRVCVLDRNRRHTLESSIPVPPGISVKEKTVEYDGFFFSSREPQTEMYEEYDLILMDFGMYSMPEVTLCSRMIFVTDMLLHHIKQLRKCLVDRTAVTRILIRDAVGNQVSELPELKRFLEEFPNRKVFFLPPDRRDVRNRYVCETFHEYQVKNASPELRDFLYDTVREWCAEIEEKEFWKRIRRMERKGYA